MKNKVTVLLDEDEWRRFDAYCNATGHKKSTLIVRLIREHLASAQYAVQGELPWPAGRLAPHPHEAAKDVP